MQLKALNFVTFALQVESARLPLPARLVLAFGLQLLSQERLPLAARKPQVTAFEQLSLQ